MKTNLFRVKEKKAKKIIIEEERTKNPFLLFLKRHKNFILISGIMLIFCLILVSTGLAFSLFQGSNDYDISYIEGSETIDSNNDPELDDEDIAEELLGEIAREQGIVLQVKTFMSSQGDVISYFTDGTAIVVKSNGKIYRISTNKNGNYGINENGKIDDTAKKILVTSTTSTLMDGTIITYYSDGSAKIEYKTQTLFVRDSNNIKIDNGTDLNNLAPSGVAPTKETIDLGTKTLIKFTDKTSLITINGQKYLVNKNTEVTTTATDINYSSQNSFAVISQKKYKDGNIITHFSNGAAIITEPNGNVTYVKKSGDILLQKQKLYEIIPNEYGFSRTTFNIAEGKKVTYFDNGAAVIINSDGTREYVEDSDDIVYDNNKNISSNPSTSHQTSERETTDGEKVFNFDNGKSQVIRENGSSYITDTSKLTFKPTGEIDDEEVEEQDPNHGGVASNPGEGIYISEAENKYNDFRNEEITKFIIKNKNNKRKILRITIEEVENYAKYNTRRLPPQYVNFIATIQGDIVADFVPETPLAQKEDKNKWTDEDGRTQYIIYEGTINAKETLEVALKLLVNYEPLDNTWQDTGFIGTIRIYVEDDTQVNR